MKKPKLIFVLFIALTSATAAFAQQGINAEAQRRGDAEPKGETK